MSDPLSLLKQEKEEDPPVQNPPKQEAKKAEQSPTPQQTSPAQSPAQKAVAVSPADEISPHREPFKVTMENFIDLGKDMTAEFLAACRSGAEKGWKPVKVAQGVTITKHLSATDLDIMRGVLKMPFSPQVVFDTVKVPEHLKFIDKYFHSVDIVETFDEAHYLTRYKYKMPMPLSNRDFVTFECNKQISDTVWVALVRAAVSEKAPEDPKNYVRGELMCSGYLIEAVPDDPNSCVVTTIAHVDLKGLVPKMFVNFDAPDVPLMLARVNNLIAERLKKAKQ